MTMNYSDPDDAVQVEVTSFDNPNHIQLPPHTNNNKKVDSSTYNKKDRLDNRFVCNVQLSLNRYLISIEL